MVHGLMQHGKPSAHGEREQALLGRAGDLDERKLHLLGQRSLGGADLDGV
jgi:hypothetical protein